MASLSVGELQEMEVDRRGESEESGDDETRTKSINGDVDPSQPTGTSKEESPVDMDTITLEPEEEDVDLVHLLIGKIEGLENLEELTTLKKPFLVHNKVTAISNLDHLTGLEMLELGSNRIMVIENLDALSSSQSLFLGTNETTKLHNLKSLHNLTVLSVQSNWITKIGGLQNLINLKELNLSHNVVKVIEGLENDKKLTTLDDAANRVKKIENISHLTELQEFWMNDIQIDTWSDHDELKNAQSLETVYLELNPLQKDLPYRRKIMLPLPSVRQIDATFIRF
ncbi:Protein phosphatase 1 regulatory subunit 7 [Crenichthys baileyi]|uniref:Protein phosphatase 1 regulatory subunit 7 n=1 Tax=Crenichthys baileyi TaxID=28760 RepID=A0AAV9RMW3_9TELE